MCVYLFTCPFITREIVDRFRCGFFHWIAKNNESDMSELFLKERKKGAISAKNLLLTVRTSEKLSKTSIFAASNV